jgi:hypothetical protein
MWFDMNGTSSSAGGISAFALLKRHGLVLLSGLEAKKTRRARLRNKKPGAVSRPGDWRSFGECSFLVYSRYTSQ